MHITITGREVSPSGFRWRLFSMPTKPPDCKRHDFGGIWHGPGYGTAKACSNCGAIRRGESMPLYVLRDSMSNQAVV